MSTGPLLRRAWLARWRVAQILLLAAIALGACWQFVLLRDSPLPAAAGAALAAYLVKRRWSDAVLLGGAVLVVDVAEPGFAGHLFVLLALPVHALTRRPRFAAAVGGAAVGLLVAAIHLKQRFAGSTLTSQDVTFFFLQLRDNVGVMATQPTLLAYAATTLLLCVGMGWFAWRSDGRPLPVRQAPQVGAMLVSAVLALSSADVIHARLETIEGIGAWSLSEGLQGEPLSQFLATAAVRPTWTPALIDTSAFRQETARRVAASRTGAAAPADIVVVLQESQFNPATIRGCPPSLCDLPVFHPPRDAIAHGPMQVHVFGGGTWVTEFALATGVPHSVFGPAGDFAPFNVAPGVHRSFMRSLKAAGYRTVAVYPVRGGMMNARAAYAAYGYDRFYDAADLGMPGRYNTTDGDMHAAAQRVLAEERKAGQPVFLLVVTIFNHADHGTRMHRVPTALAQRAAAAFADPDEARNVADYVWRTAEFERALAGTRRAVLEAGRPAVLAWFGDHQPPFGGARSLLSRIEAVPAVNGAVAPTFQTWYQVQSNVAGARPAPAPRALDIVFLPGLLAEAARAPLDDWLAANVSGREACGGLLEACRQTKGRAAYLSYLRKDLAAFQLP